MQVITGSTQVLKPIFVGLGYRASPVMPAEQILKYIPNINDNRSGEYRTSDGGCFCSAVSHPPCSACSSSDLCAVCGTIELDEALFDTERGKACIICMNRHQLEEI